MRTYQLQTSLWLPKPLEHIFGFFSDPKNLQKITPPWLRFEILSPNLLAVDRGTRIDYRLRIRGLPIRWQSEITVWEPPVRFIDQQTRSPYRMWIHEHTFLDTRAERSRATAWSMQLQEENWCKNGWSGRTSREFSINVTRACKTSSIQSDCSRRARDSSFELCYKNIKSDSRWVRHSSKKRRAYMTVSKFVALNIESLAPSQAFSTALRKANPIRREVTSLLARSVRVQPANRCERQTPFSGRKIFNLSGT